MNRNEWLQKRKGGLGGSDAAAVIGKNPWMTNVDLFRLKTGRMTPPDISDKAAVKYGIAAEPLLISLFRLDNPDLTVTHRDFNIIRDAEHPYLLANLDGEITTPDGKRGILEIKTATANGAAGWAKWNGQVPENYYCQILHYLAVTGWDFAILKAQIKNALTGDAEIRHYRFERAEVAAEIEYLRAKEIEFWTEYVEKDIEPPLLLPTI